MPVSDGIRAKTWNSPWRDKNLRGETHSEFVSRYFNALSEIARSIYLKLLWNR
jgi:hypothetical protein